MLLFFFFLHFYYGSHDLINTTAFGLSKKVIVTDTEFYNDTDKETVFNVNRSSLAIALLA